MTAAKFLIALVFAGLTALASAISDDVITNVEWIVIGVGVATAASVWIAANVPTLTWAKTAVAAVLAGLDFLVIAIDGGLSTAELVNLSVVVLGVIAVWAVPNAAVSRSVSPA
jgi:hypothetical protein